MNTGSATKAAIKEVSRTAADMKESVTGDASRVGEQIDQIRTELGRLGTLLGEIARDQGIQLADKAGSLATQAETAGKELYKSAKGQVSAVEDEVTRQVRDRPLTSIALAAFIGYLWASMRR